MQGVTSKETHFKSVLYPPPSYTVDTTPCLFSFYDLQAERIYSVTIISSAFASKSQPARHRMVYGLLKDEMAQEDGIHALQLKTKTPEEDERAQQKRKQ